jgi:hypothetical protein
MSMSNQSRTVWQGLFGQVMWVDVWGSHYMAYTSFQTHNEDQWLSNLFDNELTHNDREPAPGSPCAHYCDLY